MRPRWRPGLETTEQKYKSHDLYELINQDLFTSVDSRLIFDVRHMIVTEETSILEGVLREPLRTVTGECANWMARGHYDRFALRTPDEMAGMNLFYNMEDGSFYRVIDGENAEPQQFPIAEEEQLENDWLGFDGDACENLRQSLGMSFEEGYSVQVLTNNNDNAVILWHRSFGFVAA